MNDDTPEKPAAMVLADAAMDVIHHLQDAPAVIVTSRLADNRLWAEALSLGAYDVLAKPFNPDEVLRTVSLAWRDWHHRHENATASTTVRKAN